MEIGEDGVGVAEGVGGIDEDVGGSRGGLKRGETFERADGGGADGEDASTVLAGFLELLGGFGGDVVLLGVHGVVGDVFGGDGAEGAKADVEGEWAGVNAFLFEMVEELWGEV